MFNHPVIMLIVVVLFLAAAAWVAPKIYRLAKRGFHALRNKIRGVKPDQPAPNGSSPIPT
jgi:type III secretory pathway component EscS